jgi:hypothetical protein
MKNEFKKVLDFVEKILASPDKMQEIIETSQFYDKSNFDKCGNSYKYYIEYLEPDENGDAEIDGFNRTNAKIGKRDGNRFEDVKLIAIRKSNRNYDIHFTFLDTGEKTFLVEICCFITKYN